MRQVTTIVVALALAVGGCATTPTGFYKNPKDEGTVSLCRALSESTDAQFRMDVAAELTSRGVTTAAECQKRVNVENAVIAGIAIAATAVAVGAAANNGGFGGRSYPGSGAYGVAWDQFYNEYYKPIWRCRDRSTGRFVPDYRCGGKVKLDSTWPGWRA